MRKDRGAGRWIRALIAGLVLFAACGAVRAELFEAEKFKLYGDTRVRIEQDWDSERPDGTQREDRTRLRFRLRVGISFQATEHWSLGVRLRSGQELSQQSPHITLLSSDPAGTGDASFNLDRWFLRGTTGDFWGWVGRDVVPFWSQNEMFFDGSVTAAGLAGGWDHRWRRNKLSFIAAFLSMPVGMREFTGTMGGAQGVYTARTRGGTGITGSVSFYKYDPDPENPNAAELLTNNGARRYSIVKGDVQVRRVIDERPLLLGVDLYHNIQNYSSNDSDPFTALHHDQVDGWVVSGIYGSLAEKNQWLAAYYYGRIETFAVHNSYAQDDWVRWGTATQTRASDMQGSEFRFAWAFSGSMNVIARLYLARAITTIEDGKRFRADYNYRF